MFVTLFWSSIAILAYTYVGFPAIVFLRGWLAPKPVDDDDITPRVSIIIAAFNEQQSILEKIENLRSLNYPCEQVEIIVASDGSTDATNTIVGQCSASNVKLLALPRRGKAAALNDAFKASSGDILVFSDANSMFEKNALRELVRPFADPTVGGVAGDQRYTRAAASSSTDGGERSYWGYDRLLKYYESAAGNVISATGAIYAIRRSLFASVPEGVTDDFTTSTGVIVQGKRLVFVRQAAVYEPVAKKSADEFGRKVRVITRGLRSLLVRRTLLNPWKYGWYSWQLVSHKWLRRLMVFPLLTLLISSLILWPNGGIYRAVAIAQLLTYGLALAGSLMGRWPFARGKIIAVPTYFVMVNIACLVAIYKLMVGQTVVLWEPKRDDDAESPQRSGGTRAATA